MSLSLKFFRQISIISLALLTAVLLAACDRRGPQTDEVAQAVTPATKLSSADAEPPTEPDHGVVLVTGATGTQGGAVARELLKRGYGVRGLTRDPGSESSRALAAAGAEMVRGDYDDPASIAAAMDGVDGVFAVTLFWHGGFDSEVQQGKMLIDEAGKAGVGHFVLTSVASAGAGTGIPHFESKWQIEQYLHDSDLDWTIIRPVEFMDNWLWSVGEFNEGRLVDPRKPDSTHQWIAAKDIGFFAAEAFDNPEEWTGRTLEIAGDELSLAELQAVLSEAYGREFEYVQPSWESFEDELGEEMAGMVRWFEESGYSVDIEPLREIHPGLQTVAEYLAELAGNPGD